MPSSVSDVVGNVARTPLTPRWVVFRCDGVLFAAPLGRIGKILPPRSYTRLPGCGPDVCGMIALRGRPVTVFDFGGAAGLRPSSGVPDHRLLLVERPDRPVALVVEEVLSLESAPLVGPHRSLSIPERLTLGSQDVIGTGYCGEEPYLAIDVDNLLARLLQPGAHSANPTG